MSMSLGTPDRDRAYQVVYSIDSCHQGRGGVTACYYFYIGFFSCPDLLTVNWAGI